MPKITRRSQIALKVESSEGTAETLAGADATMAVIDPKFEPMIDQNPRNLARVTLSDMPSVSGKRLGKISWGVEIRGSGTKDTAPSWGAALRCCGFAATGAGGGVKVDYDPISTAIPSATVGMYRDGALYVIAGARGNVKFSFEVGKIARMEFEFTGKISSHADAAMLSATLESTIPPAVLNTSFTVLSLSAKVSKVNVDMGNTLSPREDIGDATGIASVLISDRKPTMTFDPEVEATATHDFLTKLEANTTGTMSLTIGSTDGNKIVFTAPVANYQAVAQGDRNGIAAWNVTAALALSTADDEFKVSHQ